jgi:hypothetical protein
MLEIIVKIRYPHCKDCVFCGHDHCCRSGSGRIVIILADTDPVWHPGPADRDLEPYPFQLCKTGHDTKFKFSDTEGTMRRSTSLRSLLKFHNAPRKYGNTENSFCEKNSCTTNYFPLILRNVMLYVEYVHIRYRYLQNVLRYQRAGLLKHIRNLK